MRKILSFLLGMLVMIAVTATYANGEQRDAGNYSCQYCTDSGNVTVITGFDGGLPDGATWILVHNCGVLSYSIENALSHDYVVIKDYQLACRSMYFYKYSNKARDSLRSKLRQERKQDAYKL
jgi:hypothetical protein